MIINSLSPLAQIDKRFSHSGSYSSHMTSKKCLLGTTRMRSNAFPANGQQQSNFNAANLLAAAATPLANQSNLFPLNTLKANPMINHPSNPADILLANFYTNLSKQTALDSNSLVAAAASVARQSNQPSMAGQFGDLTNAQNNGEQLINLLQNYLNQNNGNQTDLNDLAMNPVEDTVENCIKPTMNGNQTNLNEYMNQLINANKQPSTKNKPTSVNLNNLNNLIQSNQQALDKSTNGDRDTNLDKSTSPNLYSSLLDSLTQSSIPSNLTGKTNDQQKASHSPNLTKSTNSNNDLFSSDSQFGKVFGHLVDVYDKLHKHRPELLDEFANSVRDQLLKRTNQQSSPNTQNPLNFHSPLMNPLNSNLFIQSQFNSASAAGLHDTLQSSVPFLAGLTGVNLPSLAQQNCLDDYSSYLNAEKKVRVRSVLSEETLKILRVEFEKNPRPKKHEIERLAERVNYPPRVVQVWYQNSRARLRRLGKSYDQTDRLSPNLNNSFNNEVNSQNDVYHANNEQTMLSDEEARTNDEDKSEKNDKQLNDSLNKSLKSNGTTNHEHLNHRLSPSSVASSAGSYDQSNYDKATKYSKQMNLKDDEFAPLDLTVKETDQLASHGNGEKLNECSEKAIELLHSLHKQINDSYQQHQQQLFQQQINGQLAAAVGQGYFGNNNMTGGLNPINGASGQASNCLGNGVEDTTTTDDLNVILQRKKRKYGQLMNEMAAAVSNLNQQQQQHSNLNANMSTMLAGLPFNLQNSFENAYRGLHQPAKPAIKRRGRPEGRRTVNDMLSLNGLFGKGDALTSADKLCNQFLKQNSPLLNRTDQLIPLPITTANGQLMYPCDKCDKTFSKQSSLARHKYEHSGV